MPSDYAKKKAAKKKEAAKAKGGKKASKADEVESEVEKASLEEPTSASNGVENGVKTKEMTAEGECRNLVDFVSLLGKIWRIWLKVKARSVNIRPDLFLSCVCFTPVMAILNLLL